MASFDFRSLDLEGVEVSSGGSLPPGRYECVVKEAKLRDSKAGGKMIELSLNDMGGAGSIRHWLNVLVPKSEEATRIGREQLKALLVHGGHSNPNHPGDISSLAGLKVGINVKEESYVDKYGTERAGSRVSSFFPLEGVTTERAPGIDDDIPFR
jgi:hypothetical protein